MSAAAQVTAGASGEAPAAASGGKSGGKKKLIMLLAILLLLGGVAAGLWFSGVLPHLLGHEPAPAKEAKESIAAPMFVELPEMIANLNTGGRRASFVKLAVRLEVAREEDRLLLTGAMPRLIDLFQTYLREMHPEELRGSAGTYRLREELMARVGVAAPGAHVLDVLFTQMIVQ